MTRPSGGPLLRTPAADALARRTERQMACVQEEAPEEKQPLRAWPSGSPLMKPPSFAPFSAASPLGRTQEDDVPEDDDWPADDAEDAVPTRLMPMPACVPLYGGGAEGAGALRP